MEHITYSCNSCKKNNSINDIDKIKQLIESSYYVIIYYNDICAECKSIEEHIKKLNLNKSIDIRHNCMYCDNFDETSHYCIYNRDYKYGVFSYNDDQEDFISKVVPGSIYYIFDACEIPMKIIDGISDKSLIFKEIPYAIQDLNIYYLVCEKEI